MFGLLFIALGWFVQVVSMDAKNPKINLWFLVSNIIGTFLLIMDSIAANAFMTTLLYAITVFSATSILLKLNK